MGSSASSLDSPQPVRVARVEYRDRKTGKAVNSQGQSGFKEVKLKEENHSSKENKQGAGSSSRAGGGSSIEAGTETDLATLVGQLQREKTRAQMNRTKAREDKNEFDQPKYDNNDDLVLETFYHANGQNYSCFYQGGQRYYMDSWQTQDWRPFPKQWYKEGVLVTESVIKNDQVQQTQEGTVGQSSGGDDREGFIDHPERGKIPTYIFEERRNVHYFYDNKSGMWIKLPLAWELHSELVDKLLQPIEEALPDWKDRHDMLASLRASNYDPHDCISTRLAVGDLGGLQVPHNNDDIALVMEKKEEISKLDAEVNIYKKKLEKTERELREERKGRKAAQSMVQELQDRVAMLEADISATSAKIESLQHERPRTARPRTPEVLTQVVEKETVDPETVQMTSNAMKALHRDYVKLKMESQQRFDDLYRLFKQLAGCIGQIQSIDSGTAEELEEMKELYRREALQRKLLYNKLQELRGNIRVFCRCRFDARSQCCLKFPTDTDVTPPGTKKGFRFDKVFTPTSTQEEVFEDTRPIITSCVDGYNVCILAYGQTGSGKTYTMMGPSDNPGVNIRSIQELLKICDERDNIDYTLKASMIEIYNETVQDLLTSNTSVLEVRAAGNKIHLPNMTEMFVESVDDIQNIMELGDKNRTVAATKMNSTSSRSHLLFIITVEGRDKASGAVSTGTLTLCDLAGSERVSKTEAQGQRLVEAAAINKSLTSLGQVFTALRTGQLHIPYRNSKLTHILQPCLGGDAKAAMFVNVSPDESNLGETVSTLTFGSNARQVALGQAKKNVTVAN